MGQGGKITLVNGTKYDWNNTYQHSYQMNAWSFPATIEAGSSATNELRGIPPRSHPQSQAFRRS